MPSPSHPRHDGMVLWSAAPRLHWSSRVRTHLRPGFTFAAVLTLTFGAALSASAQTTAPEVPDPAAWARLSPQEQQVRRAELQRQLQALPPAERKAFRQRLRDRLEQLPPEERQALAADLRQRWQKMPPEERERIARERRERIQAMTPEERRALRQERRQMLERLSPAERAALTEKLPAR